MESVLPDGMQHAQAALVGGKVYIGGGVTTNPEYETKIFVFDLKTETVSELETPGPTHWSTLANFGEKLVLIGGKLTTTNKATNKLWILWDNGTWLPFSEMKQACWGASAVSKGHHLIVAGGVEDHPKYPLQFIQIYNNSTSEWTIMKSLPVGCYFLKTALHDNDTWYLGGGRWQNREVFYTSLESLISSASVGHSVGSVWRKLPTMSARTFSLAVLEGQLLAVGGVVQAGGGPTRGIWIFDQCSWILVDSFPVPCDSTCSVSVSSNKEVLFFGGNVEFFDKKFSKDIYKAKIRG